MNNNNWIADFVANSMDQALKSEEYKTLFGTQYKTAGEKCAKCHKDTESCMCDSAMADDENDARKAKKCSECHKPMKDCECKDSHSADDQDAKKKDSKDSSMADDQDAKKDPKDSMKAADTQSANTLDSSTKNPYPGKQYDADEYRNADVLRADDASDEKVSSAFDVAIDSLLTASAALDHVGLGRGSAISLKLASLVVEAKKKEKDSKKSSKDSKKSSKDSQSAKDKKSKDSKDSKKSDSKKSDSHSAKDKKSDKSSSSSSSKDSKKSSKK